MDGRKEDTQAVGARAPERLRRLTLQARAAVPTKMTEKVRALATRRGPGNTASGAYGRLTMYRLGAPPPAAFGLGGRSKAHGRRVVDSAQRSRAVPKRRTICSGKPPLRRAAVCH